MQMAAAPSIGHAQAFLGQVTNINDPDGLNRVQVKILSHDGFSDQASQLWSRVAVPFAGNNRGAFMIPEVGDEVLLTFVNGDSRYPVVIGSLWNGRDRAPETLGGAGNEIDRWSIVGKAGTRIAIEEPASGQPTIKLTTPNGVSAELTDMGGGKIVCHGAGTTITVDSSGVSIQCPGKVKIEASTLEVSAGMVTVNAAMSKFSGVVQCDTLISTSVISASYTPGAGNIW